MPVIRIADYVARGAGGVALLLGLAHWTGNLHSMLNLHMALGAISVLALWLLAVISLRRKVAPRRALLAGAWGLATLALGPAQTAILVGDLHWLVQVAHLILGLGTVALAAMLARLVRKRPTSG